MRTARAAIGWSQQEFAERLGVAKSTITRIEMLEVSPRADVLLQAMALFERAGLEVDFFKTANLSVLVSTKALEEAETRLKNEALRRSDRKSPLPVSADQMGVAKKDLS